MNGESLNADRSAAPPKPEEIERSTYEYGAEPYRDLHVLRVLYHECELSQRQIAEQCGVSQQCIQRWMKKLGVSTRPPSHLRNPSICKGEFSSGKVQYQVPDGKGGRSRFYRHQLIALLCEDGDGDWAYTPSEVFGKDTHVHHEMAARAVSVDVPQNLAVLSPSEHFRVHGSGGPSTTKRVEATLNEIFDDYAGEPVPRKVATVAPANRRKRRRILRQYRGSRASGSMSDD